MKRIISLFLCALVLAAALPFGVLAAAAETVTVATNIAITNKTTQGDLDNWASGAATLSTEGSAIVITLQKNIVLQAGVSGPISFGEYSLGPDQTPFILDLNGCDVSSATIVISNLGVLTIRDSADAGIVTYTGSGYLTTVQNAGYRMSIEGGQFVCQGAGQVGMNAAVNSTGDSELIINGGTFNGGKGAAIQSYGPTTLNGGELLGDYGVISKKVSYNDVDAGEVLIPSTSKVIVTANEVAFVVQGNSAAAGTIEVNGGTTTAKKVAGKVGSEVSTPQQVTLGGGIYKGVSESDFTGLVKDTTLTQIQLAPAESSSGNPAFAIGNSSAQELVNTASENQVVTVTQGTNVSLDVPNNVFVENATNSDVTINGEAVKPGDKIFVHEHELGSYGQDASGHWAICAICEAPGDVQSHDYVSMVDAPAGYQGRYCTVCGREELTKIPEHTHSFTGSWKRNASAHWRVCSCGQAGPATTHSLEWVVITEATETEAGERQERCSVCGYVKTTEEIPATGAQDAEPEPDSQEPTTPVVNPDPVVPDTPAPDEPEQGGGFAWWWILLLILLILLLIALYIWRRRR